MANDELYYKYCLHDDTCIYIIYIYIYLYMLHRICSWKCHYAGTRVPPFPQYASSSLHDHVIRLRILPKSIRRMQKNPGAQLLPWLCPISISSWLNHAKNSHQSPLYFGGFKLRNSISGLMRISKPSVPYPIGSMYGIYGNMDPINIPPLC